MKRLAFVLLVVLMSITGCKTLSTTKPPEEPIAVRVECRNEPVTCNTVLQLLRSPYARDLTKTVDADFVDIEVVFNNYSAATAEKFSQLEQQLKQIAGVLQVDIRRPVRAVRQPF